MLFDKCSAPCRYWKIEAVNYTLCSVHGLYVLENRTIAGHPRIFLFRHIVCSGCCCFCVYACYIFHLSYFHSSRFIHQHDSGYQNRENYGIYHIIFLFRWNVCVGLMETTFYQITSIYNRRFIINPDGAETVFFFWIFKSITFVLIINHGVDYEEQTDTCLP